MKTSQDHSFRSDQPDLTLDWLPVPQLTVYWRNPPCLLRPFVHHHIKGLMIPLENTPYLLEDAAVAGLKDEILKLQDRAHLLRSTGKLSEETLKSFYGQKRFEQVAESNALEGSTLSVGETELAILKGMTITGHDPAYVRDAIALDKALRRIADMAKSSSVTDLEQLLEIHGLILGERSGAGKFRTVPVRISGSKHTPPKTWNEIMDGMERWENWSKCNSCTSPIVRAAILHAWLSHVHPFVDGNGRTARAVSNLEFIRSGFPPIIIRKKERDRYLDGLSQSDVAGDIGPFFDLILSRTKDALHALERSAVAHDDYDPIQLRIRQGQEQRLKIWNTSITLLQEMLVDRLRNSLERHNGVVTIRQYSEPLSLEDYIELCSGHSVSTSWAFRLRIEVPSLGMEERLAWIGYHSDGMTHAIGEPGPSLFWSRPRPDSYPYWQKCFSDSPGASEMTIRQGYGDEWFFSASDTLSISESTTTNLVDRIAEGFVGLLVK